MLSILNSLLRLICGIDDGFFSLLIKSSKTLPAAEDAITTEIDQSTFATSTSETAAESTSTEPVIEGSYNFVPTDGQFDLFHTNLEEAQESNPHVEASDESTPDVTGAYDEIVLEYVEKSKRF